MQFLTIILLCLYELLVHSRFVLFQTDHRSSSASYSTYDCLYFHSTSDSEDENESFVRRQHLIPFCRRSDKDNEIETFLNTSARSISFNELYKQGITSLELLTWFIPIDIVERYQRNIGKGSNEILYNCSLPWFGSRCQYKVQEDSWPTFYETVSDSLRRSAIECTSSEISTCYAFLSNCDRGSSSICLDWREICDGKSDCIGGEDEEFCGQLELNECSSDEYRCHFGGQCIPITFVRDGRSNVDCLDGSDEPNIVFALSVFHHRLLCNDFPFFECEEITCRYPYMLSCGNGECISMYETTSMLENCVTYRFLKINRLLLDSNDECEQTLLCLLGIQSQWDHSCPSQSQPTDPIKQCRSLATQCHIPSVAIPKQPLLFGFFKLIYFTNRSTEQFKMNILPDYICFDSTHCPGLLPFINISKIDDRLTCSYRHYFPDEISNATAKDMNDMEQIFKSLIRRCLTIGTESSCSSSSLFHCSRSMKCISYHRVVDGVQDCFFGEDESYPACSLNDSRRFICASDAKKCLSPIAVDNSQADCPDNEDESIGPSEISYLKNPRYSTFCDSFMNGPLIDSILVDEAHCEFWPCNTPYVQCDNRWDCATGIDELDCPDSSCSSNEHACYSEARDDVICLSFEHLHDEIIEDCSYNEVAVTRQVYFDNRTVKDTNKSVAWNSNRCITWSKLCRKGFIAADDSKENVCINTRMALWTFSTHVTYNGRYLCDGFEFGVQKPRSGYLLTLKLGYIPPISSQSLMKLILEMHSVDSSTYTTKKETIDYCYKGVPVLLGPNGQRRCLCPPSFFGDRCQWQSQRVSLTLQLIYRSLTRKIRIFQILLMLIDDHGDIAPNIEHFAFVPSRDCGTKYNLYLLYPNQPKDILKNYSIQIDVFDRLTLTYHVSWHLSVPFAFLPVNRVATRVIIPDEAETEDCPLFCGDHGRCRRYGNKRSLFFCHCDPGYSGQTCNKSTECSCDHEAQCHASGFCFCPLNRFGRYCFLEHSICHPKNNSCKNQAICLPSDTRFILEDFTCLCQDGYTGVKCEEAATRIELEFDRQLIANLSKIAIHFITAVKNKKHERITLYKKPPIGADIVSLYRTDPFHIVLVELLNKTYYTAILREVYIPSESIHARVQRKQSCVAIDLLLKNTLINLPFWHRAKYYPLLCRLHSSLLCFYDDTHVCVCDLDRFANCFEFNHSVIKNCQDFNPCENDGQCFINNITCPTTTICVCPRCFYGAKCQFSTRDYVLSLDPIIGYHIKPYVPLSQQPYIVKITIAINTIILTIGFISSVLSIMTFQANELRRVGCGWYLLSSSILSLCAILLLTTKVWLLILSQMSSITNRIVLKFFCIITDSMLRVLLASNDWLHACVAFERFLTVWMGVQFNRAKSKKAAKIMVFIIVSITILTHLHDPIHRRLVEDFDLDEQRIWCFVRYSSFLDQFNSTMMFFHYVSPFSVNFISVVLMIGLMARSRSKVQSNTSFQRHLIQQVNQQKHLLIGPVLLIIFSVPRLVIPFYTKCMKTPRNPLLFLTGYFISFTPAIISFLIFVLPSHIYKNNFRTTAQAARRRLLRRLI